MKNTNLSENEEKYLAECRKTLKDLEMKKQNFVSSNFIANDFISEMLFISKAAADISRFFLRCTSYVPLEKISNELIFTYKKFEETPDKIKENCHENSDAAVYLFEKRNDVLFARTFSKLESVHEYNNTDKNYIRHILPLSTLKINICKNLLRFETNELTDGIANEILQEETERIRKLRYLLNTVNR